MADKKRLRIPLSFKVVPAAIVAAIAFVVMSLMGLLNFNVPGVGESSEHTNPTPMVSMEPSSQLTSRSTTDAPSRLSSEVPSQLPPFDAYAPVDVIIDGDEYWVGVEKKDDQWVRQMRTLEQIVQAALKSKGDSAGVKVRVTRTFDATAQAALALSEGLNEAGLLGDEVDERRTLVDQTFGP
ncbi:hypothetical protein [Novipirellula artificiosorum]|uniref:Biopolymer transport protein ExbD/TolR n=1 Tax=Novipirellula artificiosorum TaxID=2528016 RepID=A0A5C6E0R7_9BACT|nr:hypothetical protein [Novipirellula artificiosorum]TWU42315.1 hypothetical protein Poly41_06110 [Novipirellula artificiosorum]